MWYPNNPEESKYLCWFLQLYILVARKIALTPQFWEVAGTYECYFVILWKQFEWWGTQRCWRHSNSTYCNHISLTFLHSQAVRMLKHLLAPCSSQSHLVNFLLPNISQKMKIVKNPSLVLLHCIFTMYGLKVHSTSQWWSLCIKEDGLWAINALKETNSGYVFFQ